MRASGLRSARPASCTILLLALVTSVLVVPSLLLRAGILLLVLLLAAWSRLDVARFARSLRFVLVFALLLSRIAPEFLFWSGGRRAVALRIVATVLIVVGIAIIEMH